LANKREETPKTRIDAAHEFAGRPGTAARRTSKLAAIAAQTQPSAAAGPGTDSVAGLAEEPSTLLERQAHQLANALDQRVSELDRREALLHAEAAEIEKAARAARLWARERAYELEQSRAEMEDREKELLIRDAKARAQWRQLESEAAALERRTEKIEAAEERLRHQQAAHRQAVTALDEDRAAHRRAQRRQLQQIDLRRTASLKLVRQLLSGVEQRRQAVEREIREARRTMHGSGRLNDSSRPREQWLQHRESQLSEQDAELAAALDRLALEREQLVQERAAFRKQQAQWQQRRDEADRASQIRNARQRDDILRRREQLEQQETVLHRLRDDVAAIHRQTLELRLAAEELWARLTAKVPPAKLVKQLGEVRRRLTDQYRFAVDTIDEKRTDLESLRQNLDATQATFLKQRETLQNWHEQRRAELDQQARQLASDQEALNQREQQLLARESAWLQERTRMEAELRRLRSQQRALSERGELFNDSLDVA